jgi:hypothetical protein
MAQSVEQLGDGLDDRGIGVRFPAGLKDLSLLYNVHTPSYTKATGGSFPGGKATGT